MKKRPSYTRVIVHQFDPDAPSVGGVDTCIRDMLLLAPASERILLLGVSRSRPLRKLVTLDGEYDGIDFIPVSRVNPSKQRRRIPHSIRLTLGVMPVLLRLSLGSAILQAHRLEVGLVARLKRASGYVFFVHTNTAASLQGNSDSFWRYAPHLFRFLEARLMKNVDLTIVFNRASAKEYAQRGLRVQRMTTWFNEHLFFPQTDPAKTDGERTVAWAGRFEAPKDPVLAVEVFAQLAALEIGGADPWHFLMIGDGTLKDEVVAKARELGMLDRIEFTGSLSRAEVGCALRRSTVLLMTSHFEGSPRVMYESMGCGTPVVATAEADPDGVLILNRVGLALSTRDPRSLAEGVQLISSTDRSQVAEAVRSYASGPAVERLWQITTESASDARP